jgi:uncharacterized membrane protein YphA (DoxX/SURF4 family)
MSIRLSHVPLRLAAGSFILNSGLSKWSGDAATAAGVHGMAAGTYPVLKKVDPPLFLKALAVGEIAVGAALLAPVVPAWTAGAGLTTFSVGLLGMYAKTPGLREGLRPTQAGLPIAKDVWLAGIGVSLLIDAASDRRGRRKAAKAARSATA